MGYEKQENLICFAIYDSLKQDLTSSDGLTQLKWKLNEIEKYFCFRETLSAFAQKNRWRRWRPIRLGA